MHAGPFPSQKSSTQYESIPTPWSALTYHAQDEAGELETLGPAQFAHRVLSCRAVRQMDLRNSPLVPCPSPGDRHRQILKCQLLGLPAQEARLQMPSGLVAMSCCRHVFCLSGVCDGFPSNSWSLGHCLSWLA